MHNVSDVNNRVDHVHSLLSSINGTNDSYSNNYNSNSKKSEMDMKLDGMSNSIRLLEE